MSADLSGIIDAASTYTAAEIGALLSYNSLDAAHTATHVLGLAARGEIGIAFLAEADLALVEVTKESIASYVLARENDNWIVNGQAMVSGISLQVEPPGYAAGIGDATLTDLAAVITYADGRDPLTELKAALRIGQLVPTDPAALLNLSSIRPGGEPFANAGTMEVLGEALLHHASQRGRWTVRPAD